MENDVKMNESVSNKIPDYKQLYFTAMNKLTDLSRNIAEVQKELEELYLHQTD